MEDQIDVESTFIKLGFLIPYYHTEYLIGLKAHPWPRTLQLDQPLHANHGPGPRNNSLY